MGDWRLAMREHRRCGDGAVLAALGALCLGAVALGGCGGEPAKGDAASTGGGAGAEGRGDGGGESPSDSGILIGSAGWQTVDKADLLFVIDNSVSMLEKQVLFEQAVPALVRRLAEPGCVEPDTGAVVPFDGEACPSGYGREFPPIEDIHVGVVTSSLGGHGGPTNLCAMTTEGLPHLNDRAELLPNVRRGLPSDDPAGFLRWRGGEGDTMGEFLGRFTSHVATVGERGCGFEAPLESWYRFLVDPHPPRDMMLSDNVAVPTQVNEELLAQRAAFLRPDSLVAIVMLSDEDDCSIHDGGTSWLAARTSQQLWIATSVCETNPNDPCCHSCVESAPSGCEADPICEGESTNVPRLSPEEDASNNRCAEQKRRFGVDFLYSPQRYVDGLTKPYVPDVVGQPVPNPLLVTPQRLPRDPSLVFLAGIIGVPWQDIATEASLEPDSETLVFLSAAELEEQGRWEVILGDPEASPPKPPTDPLMQVSIGAPRTGKNPITGDEIAVAGTTTMGNPINGHDYSPNGDQQYACIFRLPTPLTPAACDERVPGACGCIEPDAEETQDPVCFEGPESDVGTTQHWGKAYPGSRLLQVLKGVGDNAVVASICPKNVHLEVDQPYYGYNPALSAISARLARALAGRCSSFPLEVDDEGQVSCSVVEVLPPDNADPRGCERLGRAEVSDEVAKEFRKLFRESGECLADDCDDFGVCAIEALRGEEREACLFGLEETGYAPGYCYIDPALGPVAGGRSCTADAPETCTNPLVDMCVEGERRVVRVVGNEDEPTPAPGALTFLVCDAAAVRSVP